jgi:hypothetical protein
MTRDEMIALVVEFAATYPHDSSEELALQAFRQFLTARPAAPPVGEAERLREALVALVRETERCDRPGLYGVGTDDPVMVAARAALASPAPQPAETCPICGFEQCVHRAPAPVDPRPAVAGIDWDAERDRCAFPSYKE